MNSQYCTKEDLRVVLDVYETWGVDSDGMPTDRCSASGAFGEPGEIVKYTCRNCGADFTPKDRYGLGECNQAWQEALSHVPTKEVA